jgi:membrane-bound serine protease (ClpP class)
MRHTLLAILVIVVASAGLALAQAQPTTTTTPSTSASSLRSAAVLDIHDEINDYSARTFEKRLASAKAAGAETIILHLRTPGGSVGAALQMSRLLRSQPKSIRTIAYVHEYAYSAGSMIAMACDEIWMEPGSVIGDCAPIIVGNDGLQKVEGAERAKMESPIIADFEQSAERNHYDPLLVRSFVQYQIVVRYMQGPQGQKRFVEQAEYEQLLKDGWKSVEGVRNPVDDATTLLTISDSTAEKIGISRGTVASLDALVQAQGLSVLTHYEKTTGESIILFLNGGILRGILTLIFMASLYSAFSHPGTGMPEVAALVSGCVLFGVPLMTGYAGWVEIVLIIVGIALLAMELFVIPGFGVTGIAGIVLLLLGLVLTFVPSEAPGLPGGHPTILPQMQQTRDALAEGFIVVSIGAVASILLWLWLARYLPKIPYMNRLVLTTTVGQTPEPDSDAGRDAMESAWPNIGAAGVAATDLRPGGVGRFFDPIVNDHRNADVICDKGFVRAGTDIVVREREGPRIYVRPVAGA